MIIFVRMLFEVITLQAELELKKDLLERIELKSEAMGVNPNFIINDILDKEIDNYGDFVLLSDVFSDLNGIINLEEKTDAIELRDMARERRL